ncbi:MAG: phosphoenolpyruvate synthase [Armatimonadetes bacterium]|nr:phosphoenolpyruvate synthase [Armatimonadota bacterium]
MPNRFVKDIADIALTDIAKVGGKNASLGELCKNLSQFGVKTVCGFVLTTDSYDELLNRGNLRFKLAKILEKINFADVESLAFWSERAREAVLKTPLPPTVRFAAEAAYEQLCSHQKAEVEVAVRSSATAEDLAGMSFAGQHSTFLNVKGKDALLRAIHECFASLFTDRAIDYRSRNGIDHLKVSLSVGVQPMVRSDLECSGVMFTLDPESGFRNAVVIEGSYGLGEMIVQGNVNPDSWTVFKPTLTPLTRPIVSRRLGSKEAKLVFNSSRDGIRQVAVPKEDRSAFCLSDQEVVTLATWGALIEQYYSKLYGHPQPMDIEWAKDGIDGKLYILQARPETVHSVVQQPKLSLYHIGKRPSRPLLSGQAVGNRIDGGMVRVIQSPADLAKVQPRDVLVAASTDPDWEPVMKQVSAIVTDQGGRTSHAAIVSREIGIPCVVGTGNATKLLKDIDRVTVSCAEGSVGYVYEGAVQFSIDEVPAGAMPKLHTKIMMNVGEPDKAFSLSSLPNDGVGLARMEFIVANSIGIHPMALVKYPNLKDQSAIREISRRLNGQNPRDFFIERLSEGIGTIAAAFYPKPVIVRTSDFKTNEYAKLVGGSEFEPKEENPMLGFRGASRYYDPRYADGFELECQALKRVREEFGLTNLKVMIPFCRTTREAELVVATMEAHGLHQGQSDLEVYGMCEIPSNVLDADRFLKIFDGYSIGSNDLTQLILGLDRDSTSVAHLFDERDPAVKRMIAEAISAAHRNGRPIGICGQAPSDFPDFAAWLVELGIDSISLNPDSILATIPVIARAERALSRQLA